MASTTERVTEALFLGAEAFAKYRDIVDLQQRNQDNIALTELQSSLVPDLNAQIQTTSLENLNSAEKTKFKIDQLTATTMLQVRQNPSYNPRLDASLKAFVNKSYTDGLSRKMLSIIQSPEASAIDVVMQGNNKIVENFVQGKTSLEGSLSSLYGNLENAQSQISVGSLDKLRNASVTGLFALALDRVDQTDPEAIKNIIELSSQLNDPQAHLKLESKATKLLNNATRQNFLKSYDDIIKGSQSLPNNAFNSQEMVGLFEFVQNTRGLSPQEIRTQAAENSSELIRKGGEERAAVVEYGMQIDSAQFLSQQGILEQPIINFNDSQAVLGIIQQGNQQIQELSNIGQFSTFLTPENRTNLGTFLANAPLEQQTRLLQIINASASPQLKPIITSDVARTNAIAGGLLELMGMRPELQGEFIASYGKILTTKSPLTKTTDVKTKNALSGAYAAGGYPQIGIALASFYEQAEIRGDEITTQQIRNLNQGKSNVIMPDYQSSKPIYYFNYRHNPTKILQTIINKDVNNIYRIFDNGQKIYTSDNIEITQFTDVANYIGFKNLGAGSYRVVLSSPTIIPVELHYEDGSPVTFTVDDYAKFKSFY